MSLDEPVAPVVDLLSVASTEERLTRIETALDTIGQQNNWICETLTAMNAAVINVMTQFQGQSPMSMIKGLMGGSRNGRPDTQ